MAMASGEEDEIKMNNTNKVRFTDLLIMLFIGLVSLACLVPMIHLVALSFSSNSAIMAGKVTLLPIEMNLTAYKAVFQHSAMVRSLLFTIVMVTLFTVVAMLMTVIAAYPLTKPNLKGRNFFLII